MNYKKAIFSLVSAFLFLGLQPFISDNMNEKNYVIAGILILVQASILLAYHRYIPSSKEAINRSLKHLYAYINPKLTDELRCSVLVPIWNGKRIRVKYRFYYEGFGGKTRSKIVIQNGSGQGIAGRLFSNYKTKAATRAAIPSKVNNLEKYYEYWDKLGFTKRETDKFKPNMGSIYCFLLESAENEKLGILSIDSCNQKMLTPKHLANIKKIFVDIISDNLYSERDFFSPPISFFK